MRDKAPLIRALNTSACVYKVVKVKVWIVGAGILKVECRFNPLLVIAPLKYESLFYMLEGGRFDAFPRAVHEPWSEVAYRPELNLTIEKRILIVYPFAMYFFVAKDNAEIGELIEHGLRNAITDGSYDELFFASPLIKDALYRANLKERIIFDLKNPNMSSLTPYDNKSLWLNINEL